MKIESDLDVQIDETFYMWIRREKVKLKKIPIIDRVKRFDCEDAIEGHIISNVFKKKILYSKGGKPSRRAE